MNLSNIFRGCSNELTRKTWIIQELKNIPAGNSLLDAGAGECQYKNYCIHLHYISQDASAYTGQNQEAGLHTKTWDTSKIDIVSDITNIPVESQSFDYILCSEVLEHLPYPNKAIEEFSRILKPQGTLLLTAPFASQTHFAPYHFCTGFNIYWYKTILQEQGFELIESSINGNYFDYLSQELLRLPITAKQYTPLSLSAYLLYVIVAPLSVVLAALSHLQHGSEKQLCFGYQIKAKKL